jgi:formylglycine-generating enzyme required for sulfatase activity
METSDTKTGCCPGSRHEAALNPDKVYLDRAQNVARAPASVMAGLRGRLAAIPGGFFDMGTRKSTFAADLDSPRRKVKLSPFLMSPHAVTNADYAAFVAATGYRTVAETEGWSFVFHLLLPNAADHPVSPPGLPWWRRVDSASWSAPEGQGSTTQGREDHPAVHIAWYDALAYCTWAGLVLPTEAQWERAARGGLTHNKFPWGNDKTLNGAHQMNTFQGVFPSQNSADDGWIGTAPVDAFKANGYGMFNMTGNVWEWVSDSFGPLPTADRGPIVDPISHAQSNAKVQRGGSFLCHESYCDRYFVHSRTRNDADSSTGNCGFRVAAPAL